MQTLDTPPVTALAALCLAVLIVDASIGKHLLSGRPASARNACLRRPYRSERRWRQ